MDVAKANDFYELAKRLAADAQSLRDALEIEFLSSQLAEVVASEYDLGEVLRVEQILGGYTNLSFAVVVAAPEGERRYFVRKYNRVNTEREVQFEHALVNHISGKGFHIAAQVFPSKQGVTYVTRDEVIDGESVGRLFAVYEMLEGEDKYTWISNRLTDREFDSGARVLARVPRARARLRPRRPRPRAASDHGLRRASSPAIFEGYAAAVAGHGVRRVLPREAAGDPRRRAIAARAIGDAARGHAPGPGPLRLPPRQPQVGGRAGRRAVRLRLVQARLPGVRRRQGIAYFCSSWEGHDDGDVRLDKAAIFVRAYQDEASRSSRCRARCHRGELALLPRMVANANLYILNWDLMAYYDDPDCDVDEYLVFLEPPGAVHGVHRRPPGRLAHIAEEA